MAETLHSLTRLKVNIKWPNDILVNRRKLAGILTEISTEIDAIDFIVVGLGLNVNTPRFPDDIKEKATSVFLETGIHYPRVKLIRKYLKWHEQYYEIFKKSGFEPVLKRWLELSDIVGRRVMVEMIDTKYTGEIKDIDKDGVLVLKDDNGESHRIISGDVTFK